MSKTELKIFLVDDDPFCVAVYQQYLYTLGYKHVVTYHNGIDCLNHLSEKPDIIFTDFLMTPINGLAMIREVKKHNADIYVVVMSGYHDKEMFEHTLNCGAFDYIVKGDHEWKQMKNVLNKIHDVKAMLDNTYT